jgi:hypothetical protein
MRLGLEGLMAFWAKVCLLRKEEGGGGGIILAAPSIFPCQLSKINLHSSFVQKRVAQAPRSCVCCSARSPGESGRHLRRPSNRA